MKFYLANRHGMQILKPANTRLSDLEVECIGVDNLLDVNLAVAGFQDLSPWVELLDQVQHASAIVLGDLLPVNIHIFNIGSIVECLPYRSY